MKTLRAEGRKADGKEGRKVNVEDRRNKKEQRWIKQYEHKEVKDKTREK